jgi:AAA domain
MGAEVNAALGKFADGFTGFRRMMAAVPPGSRLLLFQNACKEAAVYVGKGLDRVAAADELTDIAVANGLDDAEVVQFCISQAFSHIEERDHVPDDDVEPEQPRNGKGNGKDHSQRARSYLLPDPATIPPRQWLYGRHYMRAVVTATVAPGGFGKTSLSLFEALEMVKAGLRVWYISAEDDRDELDRRIAAYVQRHGITPMEMATNFFVDDKMSFPFKIAKMSKNGTQFDEQKLIDFEAAIGIDHIDVVILDPLISFHYLPENDTTSMDLLIKRLGEIAQRRQCCIELSHHVRKPTMGQAEITVYDARGAGAIVNAVRSCRVLNQMSIIEAQQAEIDAEQRPFYIRVDSGKRNMAPPEKARWRKLVSVEIENGDNVQAIEPYDYPKVFSKLTTGDVEWVKGLLDVRNYRVDPRSEEWLGLPVAERFGRDPKENKGDAKWVTLVLKTWEKNKVFKREEIEDTHRHKKWFYVPMAGHQKPELVVDNTDQEDMDI